MASAQTSSFGATVTSSEDLQQQLGYRSPFKFLRDFRADPLRFLAKLRDQADVARFEWNRRVMLYVFDPDSARHVLQGNHRNYQKEAGTKRIFKPLLGDGMFTSDGDRWLSERRAAQPAFHKKQIASLIELMTTAIAEMLARWDRAAAIGETLDVGNATIKLALAIASRSLFASDTAIDEDRLRRLMNDGFEYLNHKFYHPFTAPLFVPTRKNLRMRRAIRELDRIAYGVLDGHRNGASGDMLSMLLAGAGGHDRKLMRDEIVTFIGAGSETTAVTLSWCIYLLSRHPEARGKLREEVSRVLNGRTPTSADVGALRYSRMVVNETLRLYPPAFATSRTSIGADEIRGQRVPAGASVILGIHTIQRDPRFWPEPDKFDPDRFSPERSAGRHDYAFFPFGGGPRQCIGEEFALTEAALALAMISQRYDYEILPEIEVRPNPVFTLRPHPGVFVKLHRI